MVTIKSFYAASNVFVTGGTGFLGKVLLEKLIRTCPDLQTIHILIRPKKGLSPQQRLLAVQNDKIFDRVRAECPSVLSKLHVISGDICSPRLGLSDQDEEKLSKEVSVAFHVAATVRFDEDMSDAAAQNTLGTLKVMDLCSKMEHLKSVVHVSTSYCNPKPEMIKEDVEVTPDSISKESFLMLAQNLPKPIMDSVGQQLLGAHSNTYTFTKAMSEQVVADYRHKFPVCIVRPSIVTSSVAEPCPGWLDSFDGLTNVLLHTGMGGLRTIMCRSDGPLDIIPVDMVSNTIIAAAWANQRSFDCEQPIKVINCTSGDINPITWEEQRQLTLKWSRLNPFNKVFAYPSISYHTNRHVNSLQRVYKHWLPAALMDLFSVLRGQKPRMAKLVRGVHKYVDHGEWVTFHYWRFQSDNMRELVAEVEKATDGAEFNCDISKLDWSEYMRNYLMGIRQFLLGENEDSLVEARKRISRLYWTRVYGYSSIVGATAIGSYLTYGLL